MNVQNGLERISVVWWGLCGALAALMIGAGVLGNTSDTGLTGLGVGGLVAAYVAHRITCWIIAGFFAPRS